jgi:ribosomal protein S18 acetylase RimI-like enzyme
MLTVRTLRSDDFDAVAALIHRSTNAWYVGRGHPPIFAGDPSECLLFCRTYDALDPGACLLAIDDATGRLAGSCFAHPRETHTGIGIVNVDPDYFGRGVAGTLLRAAIAEAERRAQPVRLVSSAMNLDSYALYTRLGFVPRVLYQDMILPEAPPAPNDPRLRPATLADLDAIVALEERLSGIRRPGDHRHFLENAHGLWSVWVAEQIGSEGIDGFLAAVAHPASNLLGPGAAVDQETALALILAQRARHPACPLLIVPATAETLVARLYALGARTTELHVLQVRGAWSPPLSGAVLLPTFLPESG